MITFYEVRTSFVNTLAQASLSAAGALVVGAIGALGILSLNRYRRAVELICLIPNFLPSIFVILASLNILRITRFGIGPVVFLHVLINAGLVAVVLAQRIEERLGTVSRLAALDGARFTLFARRVALPMLKPDLGFLFLFVFTMCCSSLSIPLMMGGSSLSSLEVLIYQQIRNSDNWRGAIFLSLLQMIILAILMSLLNRFFAPHKMKSIDAPKKFVLPYFKWKVGLIAALFGAAFLLVGLLPGISVGYEQIRNSPQILEAMSHSIQGTVGIGISAGAFTIIALFVISLFLPSGRLDRFLIWLTAPSAALIGLLFIASGRTFPFFKIGFALALLFFNGLYRLKWSQANRDLNRQVLTARSMGARRFRILKSVQIPQLWGTATFLAGIAAFWAAGDFLMSGLLAGYDISLGVLIQGLMGSYRLEIATFLVWILLLVGSALLLFFWSLRYVVGSAFKTQAR